MSCVFAIAVTSYAAFTFVCVAAIVAAYRITNTIEQLRQLHQFLALIANNKSIQGIIRQQSIENTLSEFRTTEFQQITFDNEDAKSDFTPTCSISTIAIHLVRNFPIANVT